MTDRINDLKSEIDHLKQQLTEQKNTYESRIKWLERQLESKEAEALEGIKDVQKQVIKLLEHKGDVIVLPEEVEAPEPEIVEPERKIEPKKKKGRLWRVLEAALD